MGHAEKPDASGKFVHVWQPSNTLCRIARRPLPALKHYCLILFHDRAAVRQDSPPGPALPGFSDTGVKHLSGTTFQLHDATGQRKYLTRDERDAFLEAAGKAGRQARTFCMTLAYTGSRVSEALALTADRVDVAGGTIVFESLKKRRGGLYRAVPVPSAVLDALDLVHGRPRRGNVRLWRSAAATKAGTSPSTLWPWGRATAWRRVPWENLHRGHVHGRDRILRRHYNAVRAQQPDTGPHSALARPAGNVKSCVSGRRG